MAVESEIAAICKPRWFSEVLTTTLTSQTPTQLRLTFHTDTDARSRLEAKLFGKRTLFTSTQNPHRHGPHPEATTQLMRHRPLRTHPMNPT